MNMRILGEIYGTRLAFIREFWPWSTGTTRQKKFVESLFILLVFSCFLAYGHRYSAFKLANDHQSVAFLTNFWVI